jgi:large subunit ribosomal protein L5
MENLKKYYTETIKPELKEKGGFKNIMEVPKILKIVINRGLGEAIGNSKIVDQTLKHLEVITGQKAVKCVSKKAISNFKIREGQVIGAKVTLRADKMYDFLSKMLNIVLPKIRDFRGIPINSFDGQGNYTLGLKEEGVFAEVTEDLDKSRGFDITFVTSAKNDRDARLLLDGFQFPFRK